MKVAVLLFAACLAVAVADSRWYVYPEDHDTVEVPASWWCPEEWWGESRNESSETVDCDCGCGAFDPDCDFWVDEDSTTLSNGFMSEYQMYGGSLFCSAESQEGMDPEFAFCHRGTGECEAMPPHPWATHCPPDWYNEVGSNDPTPDCDCNCLIYDVDCSWEDEIVSTFCSDYQMEGDDPSMWMCSGDANCYSTMEEEDDDSNNGGDRADNIINFNFAGMIPK